jgi:hypothetical protein
MRRLPSISSVSTPSRTGGKTTIAPPSTRSAAPPFAIWKSPIGRANSALLPVIWSLHLPSRGKTSMMTRARFSSDISARRASWPTAS